MHLKGRLREAEQIYCAVGTPMRCCRSIWRYCSRISSARTRAITAYRMALALDPGLADAHFNPARLHEHAGNTKDALRHLLAYRRLTQEH